MAIRMSHNLFCFFRQGIFVAFSLWVGSRLGRGEWIPLPFPILPLSLSPRLQFSLCCAMKLNLFALIPIRFAYRCVCRSHTLDWLWMANRFACDLRIYCPGGKLILQAGDLPRSVISSDRAIAFYEVAHFVLVYWSYSHLSLPQIPRHRWQAMAS